MGLTTVDFQANVLGYLAEDVVDLDIKTDGLREAIAGNYVVVTLATPNREPNEEDAGMQAMQRALAPYRVVKADTSITLTGAGAGVWVDVDATGTIAARDKDLLWQDVEVGDWVEINTDGYTASDSDGVWMSYFPVVNGAYSGNHTWSHVNAGTGPASLLLPNGFQLQFTSVLRYQVKAEDIDAEGNLRMRLRHNFGPVGATRQLVCGSGFALQMEGTGPFGLRPPS